MREVKSSNISHIGHSGDVLTVRFHSGATWDYHGVTAEQHKALMEADSIGKHFGAHIRGKFTEKRVDKK